MATQANPGAEWPKIFESAGGKRGGDADRRRDALVREEWELLRRRGVTPARALNLHRHPVKADLGELGTIVVGPGETLEIRLPRMAMRDGGDGNFTPRPVLPIELAREVARACEGSGGLVAWEGDGEPPADLVGKAARAREAWLRRIYARACADWSRFREHRFIDERQREAARELLAAGEIRVPPEWLEITAMADERACPDCGERVKASARVCRFCRFRLVPEGAPGADADEAPEPTRRKK